jgi:hypothetical protein
VQRTWVQRIEYNELSTTNWVQRIYEINELIRSNLVAKVLECDCCDFELTYVNNRLVKNSLISLIRCTRLTLCSTDAVLDWRCTWLIIWHCNNYYNELASEYEYSEREYNELSTTNLRNKRIDKKSFGCWQGGLWFLLFWTDLCQQPVGEKFVDFVNSLYSTDAVLDWRCTNARKRKSPYHRQPGG